MVARYGLLLSRSLRIALYLATAFSAVIVAVWLLPPSLNKPAYELGKRLALLAIMVLSLQVILAGRFKWISRPFGFDKLLVFHKAVAVVLLSLLIAHPVLLAIGRNDWRLLYGIGSSWGVWAGKAALVLILLQSLFSILRDRIRMRFEVWRSLHNLGIVAVVLAFIHSFYIGQDISKPAMRTLWAVALIAVMSVYVYHKWLGPWYRRKHPFCVRHVKQETSDVWTLEFEPMEGQRKPDYLPGQFHFIDLKRDRGLPREEHHFTISSSPTQADYLSSTIKASGDFTATIGETRKGDLVAIQGPYGRFSYRLHQDSPELILIAGGIGITPLMSMLRHMRDTGCTKKVLLLYGNRTAADIVFRAELERMEKSHTPDFNVIHVLSDRDTAWPGERGFVDKMMILKHAGPHSDGKSYYVCGPPLMTNKVRSALKELGVPRRLVHYERFSL